MKKVIWTADLSTAEVMGGAELVDEHLMQVLSKAGHQVEFVRAANLTPDVVKKNLECVFIVSNFISLPSATKKILKTADYFIIEHDHKYLRSRDPSQYKNLKAPPTAIINRDFYKNAQQVFCQSTAHGNVVTDNLELSNITSFGCTFWSSEHHSILRSSSAGAGGSSRRAMRTR